jgi:hypothetical protein
MDEAEGTEAPADDADAKGTEAPADDAAPGGARGPADRRHFVSQLAVVVPTDWLAKESVTVLHPDGIANVIVSTEPLDDSVPDAETYATQQGNILHVEFDGYHELAFHEILVPGLPGRAFFRDFTWLPEGSAPIRQLQIYAVDLSSGRGVTATATTPWVEFPALQSTLMDLLLGVTLLATGPIEPGEASS